MSDASYRHSALISHSPGQAAPSLTPDPFREGYRYFAFISYSRRDLAIAHELQRHLEGYRLPAALCEQYPQACRELTPLFRDQNNLGAGPLDVKLREALAASRFLIVICSENSARPNAEGRNYIDDEIRSFLSPNEEKQLEHVIPVIYRRDESCRLSSCLPPVLLEKNMNGYDVLDKGKERCFSDVVATMLGLNIDALWNHFVEDTKPQVACHADYVMRHNIPHGICKLGPEVVQHREYHYRITTQGGFVREVVCCNSAGIPFKPDAEWLQNRPVGIRLEYDAQGQVIKQVHIDEEGKELAEWVFTGSRFIDFQDVGNLSIRTLSHLEASGSPWETQSSVNSVTRLDVQRDAEGCITQEMFCNIYRMRVSDENGIWGRRYERDALGRITAMLCLNREGKPTRNKRGLAGYRLDYEGEGKTARVSLMTWVDDEGRVVYGAGKWAKRVARYNDEGNITDELCLGTDDQPCVNDEGYAGRQKRYDDRGNCVKECFQDVDGTLCLNKDGVAILHRRYDERGMVIEKICHDNNGLRCLNHIACSGITRRYDEHGRMVEESYTNTSGHPCLSSNGFARLVRELDERGHVLSLRTLGMDGQPCPDKMNGHTTLTRSYDERGNLTEEAYFDAGGKPCIISEGFARRCNSYDERGNLVEQAYFDTNGKLCACSKGYARATAHFIDSAIK